MENLSLTLSLILNFLLIITTLFLIWDRFKPEKTNLVCKLVPNLYQHYKYNLVISNLMKKEVVIINILLDKEKIQSLIEPHFPIILQPQNEIDLSITLSKSDPRPSECNIEILKGRKTKTLSYVL